MERVPSRVLWPRDEYLYAIFDVFSNLSHLLRARVHIDHVVQMLFDSNMFVDLVNGTFVFSIQYPLVCDPVKHAMPFYTSEHKCKGNTFATEIDAMSRFVPCIR